MRKTLCGTGSVGSEKSRCGLAFQTVHSARLPELEAALNSFMKLGQGPKACVSTKTCLAFKNACSAKVSNQPELHTVTIAATGTQVNPGLSKKFAKQNFLPISFMKLGPDSKRALTFPFLS